MTLTTANLIPKPSATSGVQPVAQINPQADLISLTELVEGGGRMRTVMVAMIMSIVSAESAERSIVKKNQGNRDQNQIRYQRRMTFMCLHTDSTANVFMIFHGYGHNENLLNGMDPSHKYNGALRECEISLLNASHVA